MEEISANEISDQLASCVISARNYLTSRSRVPTLGEAVAEAAAEDEQDFEALPPIPDSQESEFSEISLTSQTAAATTTTPETVRLDNAAVQNMGNVQQQCLPRAANTLHRGLFPQTHNELLALRTELVNARMQVQNYERKLASYVQHAQDSVDVSYLSQFLTFPDMLRFFFLFQELNQMAKLVTHLHASEEEANAHCENIKRALEYLRGEYNDERLKNMELTQQVDALNVSNQYQFLLCLHTFLFFILHPFSFQLFFLPLSPSPLPFSG